ncbi:MAG: pyrroline-5-carboxylate reductase [Eubacteriaceae bacterium]|nr:pyrroline-5-carboxylate reductase [Eubacteriaceae bacterium]
MRLGIIGLGNMGLAILKCFSAKSGAKEDIFVYDKNREKTENAVKTCGVSACDSEGQTAQKSDFVLFAVKPNDMKNAIEAAGMTEDKILISVAAGMSLSTLSELSPLSPKIIRVMPNVALTAGEGMCGICASNAVSEGELEQAIGIFSSGGRCLEVQEAQMDAVGALSGSSPAYAFMFMESLAQGGILCGMKKEAAYAFAAQTVLGAAKMVLEGGNPAVLRDSVTSPGGTTIEGVRVLEEAGFRAAVINAVKAAYDKTKLL